MQRALEILQTLRQAQRPLQLSEIAREVGIDLATCKRLAGDLMEKALIERHPETKLYTLGWGLAELAGAVWTPDSLAQLAVRHLEELRDKTLHTVELCIRLGSDYFVRLSGVLADEDYAEVGTGMLDGVNMPFGLATDDAQVWR